MPKRNTPSKVARDAKGKPVKGTDTQRRASAILERRRREAGTQEGSGEVETPLEEQIPSIAALNFRQRQFVRYYLTDSNGNATDAARRAGYLDPEVAGFRLKRHAAIAHAIESKVTEAGMTADAVLDQLTEMAEYDIGACLDPETGLVDIKRVIAAGLTRMIKEVTPTANGVSVKLYSRKEALELMGKYRKLFVERISLEGFDPATMTTEQLRAFVAAGKGKQGP
jgi:phage terminase small subunit